TVILAGRHLAPACQRSVQALRIRGVEKFNQARQASRAQLKRKRAAQGVIQINALARSERASAGGAHQQAQPGLVELDVLRSHRKLQRIESRGSAVPELEILSAERTYQNFEPPVLVEDHLGGAVTLEQAHEEADEYRLSGTRWPAYEGMSGVFAAAAVCFRRVAGVQGEVVGRASAGAQQRERLPPVIAAGPAQRGVVG